MKRIITAHYEIRVENRGWKSGRIRTAFLTDLHNCCTHGENRRIMRLLDRADPDLVLCGGDMIVAKPGERADAAVRFMRELAVWLAKRGQKLYCGTGNHEYRARIYTRYGTLYEDYRKPLDAAGVVFLANSRADLEVSGIPVTITGFDLAREYYSRWERKIVPAEEMRRQIGEPPRDRFNILLAHNPAEEPSYFEWGADLTLSGHYHGGIVRIGRHGGLVTPDFGFFRKYVYGLKEKDGKYMIISAGIGEHTIPVRIFNPRELVVIDAVF